MQLAFGSNLVQMRDGYLWLSPQSGLTRFDGVRFAVFDTSNAPALLRLAHLETYPVLEDAHGALWIGSDAGLFLYEPLARRRRAARGYVRRGWVQRHERRGEYRSGRGGEEPAYQLARTPRVTDSPPTHRRRPTAAPHYQAAVLSRLRETAALYQRGGSGEERHEAPVRSA